MQIIKEFFEPKFLHDCQNCEFIISIAIIDEKSEKVIKQGDFYRACKNSHNQYLVRFGDYGGDYMTIRNLNALFQWVLIAQI